MAWAPPIVQISVAPARAAAATTNELGSPPSRSRRDRDDLVDAGEAGRNDRHESGRRERGAATGYVGPDPP